MKNAGRQRGIGTSTLKDVGKVFYGARATRSNDRNPNGTADGSRQFAIEAGSRAIRIH
jgi:hypothetical protein